MSLNYEEFVSNEDFAEKYRALIKELLPIEQDMFPDFDEADIPTIKEIECMLVNYDTGVLEDDLNDLKDYINQRYDAQDPDCAYKLRRIELLLDYITK